MTERVSRMVCRPPRRRVVALLPLCAIPLFALAACIEVDPPPPPPPNDPELAYALYPANLTPDELVVERGDIIEILNRPVPPRIEPDHQVNFSNHFLIECVSNEDEHQSDFWPPCSLAVSEGYIIIERAVGQELASVSCNASVNYVPGGAINASVSECPVPNDYTVAQGDGLQWSQWWRVNGCDPTWITFRHTGSIALTPATSVAMAGLSDTTRITVSPPC